MKIFKTIFPLILLCLFGVSTANAGGTIYLVRHAEKQDDGTKDPQLTEQGKLRAEYLAQHLSLAKITKIYSTNYHRTQQTAKPLSDMLGIAVRSYDPNNLEEFAESLKELSANTLVVGHSNTTPTLTALLSGEAIDVIEEDEYDNLYQLVWVDGKTQLNRFKIFPVDSMLSEEADAKVGDDLKVDSE